LIDEPVGQFLAQVLSRHLGVDLRGADVGVAQHLLDVPDVGPALAQVGADGVSPLSRG
jgi:hypothetical protein